MDRMKTFGIYALIVILFFIFSNVMIDIAIKCSCSPIDIYQKTEQGIEINISEAKATYANGYVGGSIKNENSEIEKTYIKIDLYSKRDVCLGTKYVTIENLKLGESRDFRMGFKFTDVEYTKISRVNQIEETVEEQSFISENLAGVVLLTTVVLLCFF